MLKLLDEANSALTLQVLWSGFSRGMVSYSRQKREKGKSRWTLGKKVKLIVDSIISFSFAPIRFATVVGTLFFCAAVVWGLVVLIARLSGVISEPGYTTLAIILLFSSGLILLILGILGEYIWRAVEAGRNRPVFIVDEVEDGKKKA